MRKILIYLLLGVALLGCNKDNTINQAKPTITTILSVTDTLGNPKTSFQPREKFYLTVQMLSSTRSDQNYTWTGPLSEIYILRNDSIVSRQFQNYAWPQVILHETLKSDSVLTNRWLAPFNELSSQAGLAVGNYSVDVFINARFQNAEIAYPQQLSFTIISYVVVRKPNIYLYPVTTRMISVKLEFPSGGSVIQSQPLYFGGWTVNVEPSGKINGQYDYLFYESNTPDMFQYSAGWIVAQDSLTSFFSNNLLSVGFNQRETKDFLDYWIPLLKTHAYYFIYPQFNRDIEQVIRIKVSDTPDALLRLFYVIKGANSIKISLPTPLVPKFERKGFVVTEWGVILKD
jgi:hypothetical protein